MVLRLFLLSTLDAEGADDAGPLSFGRLVAEFGVVSMQALNDWAESALDRIESE